MRERDRYNVKEIEINHLRMTNNSLIKVRPCNAIVWHSDNYDVNAMRRREKRGEFSPERE